MDVRNSNRAQSLRPHGPPDSGRKAKLTTLSRAPAQSQTLSRAPLQSQTHLSKTHGASVYPNGSTNTKCPPRDKKALRAHHTEHTSLEFSASEGMSSRAADTDMRRLPVLPDMLISAVPAHSTQTGTGTGDGHNKASNSPAHRYSDLQRVNVRERCTKGSTPLNRDAAAWSPTSTRSTHARRNSDSSSHHRALGRRHVCRQQETPSLRLHNEIVHFVSVAERMMAARRPYLLPIIRAVEDIVRVLWPQAQVRCFGSFVTGLSLPTSDLDLVVLRRQSHAFSGAASLRRLGGALRKKKWVAKLQTISSAQIPVIKCEALSHLAYSGVNLGRKQSSLHNSKSIIDITFDSNWPPSDMGPPHRAIGSRHTGLLAVPLIRFYIAQLPALQPLVLVLKQFLIDRRLHRPYAGGLSSYCLVWIVVAFLLSPTHGDRDVAECEGNRFDTRDELPRSLCAGSGGHMGLAAHRQNHLHRHEQHHQTPHERQQQANHHKESWDSARAYHGLNHPIPINHLPNASLGQPVPIGQPVPVDRQCLDLSIDHGGPTHSKGDHKLQQSSLTESCAARECETELRKLSVSTGNETDDNWATARSSIRASSHLSPSCSPLSSPAFSSVSQAPVGYSLFPTSPLPHHTTPLLPGAVNQGQLAGRSVPPPEHRLDAQRMQAVAPIPTAARLSPGAVRAAARAIDNSGQPTSSPSGETQVHQPAKKQSAPQTRQPLLQRRGNLGELLHDFLRFYGAHFDPARTGIALQNQDTDGTCFFWLSSRSETLVVCDPIRPTCNLGHTVRSMHLIQAAFLQAADSYAKAEAEDIPHQLLACFVRPSWTT